MNKLLVINCGSSSIKFKLYAMPAGQVLAGGELQRIGGNAKLAYRGTGERKIASRIIPDHHAGMELIIGILMNDADIPLASVDEIVAVGHRVVHGAEKFTGSVLLTDDVITVLEECSALAPLHTPPNLEGIRASIKALPHAMQAGCFDTAFHQSLPEKAYMYALPYKYYGKHGYRKYGFHGTSHKYVAGRVAALLGKPDEDVNCITCHLGNGCSITAVAGGRSVDTSMGMTPLEGLVMGTRSGDIDPALIFFIEKNCGLSIDAIDDMLNKESGLLGLSGISNDVRELLAAADTGNERARLALDVFAYRIRKYIGAYTAVLGTVDAVAFTGGIGENAAGIRADVCAGMEQIGLSLDQDANAASGNGERAVHAGTSRIAVFVIPTDEEGAIAADTWALFNQQETNTK